MANPIIDFDRDYYADLELQWTDEVGRIKKQYRKLCMLIIPAQSSQQLTVTMCSALEKHPNRLGGSNEAFMIINEAYKVLTNKETKEDYDADYRARPPPSPQPRPRPQPSRPQPQPRSAHSPMERFERRPPTDWYVDARTDLGALDEVLYSYYKELSDYQAALNINWGIKMDMAGGRVRFGPRQVYSLDSGLAAPTEFLTVVKLGENSVKMFKVINIKDIADVADAAKEGWDIPTCAERPREVPKGKESRKFPRPYDTPDRLTPWNPYHVRRFLRVGLDLTMNAGTDYKPGEFMGEAPSGRSDKDNISRIKHFLPPANTCADVRSATSHGHDIVHPRPSRVKAGWGQFDTLYEWQAHGRQVDKDWPAELNWHDKRPNRFVAAANPRVVADSLGGFTKPRKDGEHAAVPGPRSLWKKFHYTSGTESDFPLPRSMGL